MGEKEFMAIAKRVLGDDSPLKITISIGDAWYLLSGIQLAVRHPGLNAPLRGLLTKVGRQFQTAIEQAHPDAKEVLEAGWDERQDR